MSSSSLAQKVIVEPSQVHRLDVIAKAGGNPEFQAQLKGAPVLIVPRTGHMNHVGPVFPPGTLEVFDYMRGHLPESVAVELASTDEDYLELGLHGDVLWLPTLLLTAANAHPYLTSVTLNVLSNYLTDWMKAGLDRVRGRVHSQVLIDKASGTVSISYDGPPNEYKEVMMEALRRALPDEAPSTKRKGTKRK